jgi:hypothetical protein
MPSTGDIEAACWKVIARLGMNRYPRMLELVRELTPELEKLLVPADEQRARVHYSLHPDRPYPRAACGVSCGILPLDATRDPLNVICKRCKHSAVYREALAFTMMS